MAFSRVWLSLVIVVSVGAAGVSLQRARAQETYMSCAWVAHVYYPPDEDVTQFVASSGIDGHSYNVEYSVHNKLTDTEGPWTAPTETSLKSSLNGATLFRYVTPNLVPEEHDYVQWRVSTWQHRGTHVLRGEEMRALDGLQNNNTLLSGESCEVESKNWTGFYVIYDSNYWQTFLPRLGSFNGHQ